MCTKNRKDNNSIFEKCVQAKNKDVPYCLGTNLQPKGWSRKKEKTVKMQRLQKASHTRRQKLVY